MIDGNHRLSLFLKHGIKTWNCRVISKETKMKEMDIRRMADFCNNKHDGAAVHTTYFEHLEHIREIMSEFKKGSGYDWIAIGKNFVSSWYSQANLKRAGTVLNSFKKKNEVTYLSVLIILVLESSK